MDSCRSSLSFLFTSSRWSLFVRKHSASLVASACLRCAALSNVSRSRTRPIRPSACRLASSSATSRPWRSRSSSSAWSHSMRSRACLRDSPKSTASLTSWRVAESSASFFCSKLCCSSVASRSLRISARAASSSASLTRNSESCDCEQARTLNKSSFKDWISWFLSISASSRFWSSFWCLSTSNSLYFAECSISALWRRSSTDCCAKCRSRSWASRSSSCTRSSEAAAAARSRSDSKQRWRHCSASCCKFFTSASSVTMRSMSLLRSCLVRSC
mmetsp:Transcript_160568/g.490835  ORF Transcript_160568/g.490835 Transcript_160568/m.490835 type:complete len:273 (-) Transcript_160568:306-1124(-)